MYIRVDTQQVLKVMLAERDYRDKRSSVTLLSDEDLNLVRRCQNKDAVAFERLIRKHKSLIIAIVNQFSFRSVDSEDLLQEVSIRVWRSINTLRDPRLFVSWLRTTSRNVCYDHLRRNSVKVSSLDEKLSDDGSDDLMSHLSDETRMPCSTIQMIELENVLSDAVAQLPVKFRDALLMRELNGMSYEQIASRENCEVGTIKSRISRARTKVRSLVTPYLNECA